MAAAGSCDAASPGEVWRGIAGNRINGTTDSAPSPRALDSPRPVAGAPAKPAVKGHQAVIGNDIPTKDSIIEFRFKLGGAQSVTAEYDDRKFNGSHYGHICMARIAATGITLTDQKGLAVARPEGATGEPPPPAGRKNVTFPLSLDPETWHTFMLETVGDTMRASIDGKPVAFLQSPGIAHPTKSKVEFGCMGKDGFFDDLKVWNAEPAK